MPTLQPAATASVKTRANAITPAEIGIRYKQIAEQIAAAIRAGTLLRGDRMPSVRELARQEAVSMATAIQAYRTLEDAQLIEARPRSGYFVAVQPLQLREPGTTRPPSRSREVDIAAIVADVMRLANDPAYISFGAACPKGDLFDVDRIRRTLNRNLQRHRHTLSVYADTGPGQLELRRVIARYALRLGSQFSVDDVVITSSCTEAMSLCLRTVTQPGDVVALESPGYFGILELLQTMGLRVLEIPTHPRTGMSLDALQLALETQQVNAVLTVPTLSNPLGACMPLPDRRRLAQMAARFEVPVIEDVLYNDLAEQEERRRTVQSYDSSGYVMVCGSFSKTVAPGLRLGWLSAGRYQQQLLRLKNASSRGQTAILEFTMADLLSQPGTELAFRRLRAEFALRVAEARQLIAQYFPKGTRVTDPQGGFILWLEFPKGFDSHQLYLRCLDHNIVIVPGALFSASKRYSHCIRLGVSGLTDAAHRDALRTIGRLASEMARELEVGGQRIEGALARV